MSDDDIAEIRARHSREDRWCYSPSPQMHDDRATLLAEVDRQRAEIEQLRAGIQSLAESLRASLDAAIRQRDEARAEIERLRADLLTQQGCCDGAASQDAHIRREREEHKAEVEKLRAEIDGLEAELALMKSGFEVAYRMLGDKP